MDQIKPKFLDFARARAVDGAQSMRSGRFSALPGRSTPDLFGSLDMLYAGHIVGCADELIDGEGRNAWIDHILVHQDEEGWFRSFDKQSHGVEHATAYALGGLQILVDGDSDILRKKLKPLNGFKRQIAPLPNRSSPPFEISMLDRLHFWRGSHRVGGLAAIVGAIDDLALPSEPLIGIADPRAWLDGWWSYFAARINTPTGYWALAPWPLQRAFDMLYRMRHRPRLAAMGGAVHLYWISEKMGRPMPHPAALIPTTADLMEPSGLYEGQPYCIDLDANFLIGRALAYLEPGDPLVVSARQALATNRAAVLAWFDERPPEKWRPNSHALPGAFAAIGEADRVLDGATPKWRDIFATTWWL